MLGGVAVLDDARTGGGGGVVGDGDRDDGEVGAVGVAVALGALAGSSRRCSARRRRGRVCRTRPRPWWRRWRRSSSPISEPPGTDDVGHRAAALVGHGLVAARGVLGITLERVAHRLRDTEQFGVARASQPAQRLGDRDQRAVQPALQRDGGRGRRPRRRRPRRRRGQATGCAAGARRAARAPCADAGCAWCSPATPDGRGLCPTARPEPPSQPRPPCRSRARPPRSP